MNNAKTNWQLFSDDTEWHPRPSGLYNQLKSRVTRGEATANREETSILLLCTVRQKRCARAQTHHIKTPSHKSILFMFRFQLSNLKQWKRIVLDRIREMFYTSNDEMARHFVWILNYYHRTQNLLTIYHIHSQSHLFLSNTTSSVLHIFPVFLPSSIRFSIRIYKSFHLRDWM